MNRMLSIACGAAAAAALIVYGDVAEEDLEQNVLEEAESSIFWGFGSYGVYSGYQLYGSLVNSEPTLQGYLEGNMNLQAGDLYLGYLGVGVWSNTDLTDKRRDTLGKAFNEWDFNLHWGRTFWFDEEETWGLDYRTSVVWYYYPHRRHDHMNGSIATTMDWNHSFALVNPYIVPFLDVIHEYHESDGTLLQFGLKREFADAFDVEGLSIVPSLTFVWRNRNYGWCFPNYGLDENGAKIGSGVATAKLQLDATYQLSEHFGVFAKVAYCRIIDSDLRDAADEASGADYGKYKDFVWGGVGVTCNF